MRSVELFAGAGGLAIGMARAGFHHAAVLEWDHDACETFRLNQKHNNTNTEGWPVYEADARQFDYSVIRGDIHVVSGGPPCQPFSLGGRHMGRRDERDMFPEAVRAVRALRPQAFIFENVKGLRRESFQPYFSYILLQLHYPEIERRRGERWSQHRARLEQHHSSNTGPATYNVLFNVLNAADYGVPQRRERVFIVGFRSDIGASWAFPTATHSEDALVVAKWIHRSYWDEHEVRPPSRATMSRREAIRLRRLDSGVSPLHARWRTTRDALLGLSDPEKSPQLSIANHQYTPGARSYVGHTGSSLDEPSKTLKAGYHGVPGGENMFIKDDGRVRYFTVREAARLQTFPDEYEFTGSWSQTMRQLGNAVPVALAEVVANSVAKSLEAVRGGRV